MGSTLEATQNAFAPAGNVFSGGLLAKVMSYAWLLFPVVIVAVIIGVVIIIKTIRKKKTQWTHKLKVRRVLHGAKFYDKVTGKTIQKKSLLSDPIYINMRRFPLIKRAEVFELETPLLGGYLLPELDEYSGENEFSIILDTNNRIYTNKGEFFNPDDSCVNVSAKHAEIDIARSSLKADFQNINQINKRVEWATIAKYAFFTVAIVAFMIIVIVGISKWGDSKAEIAKSKHAEALAMASLADAIQTIESVVNTQKLEIIPMMKEVYKTEDLSHLINKNYSIIS